MSGARVELELGDVDATARFAAALAGVLRPGDVVLLDGPLGAGKTTLVRALAAALGAEPGAVSSPTFVIAQSYELAGTGSGGVRRLVHADAYRLGGDDPGELELLGWDVLSGSAGGGDGAPSAAAVIEWGERVEASLASLLPPGVEPARLALTIAGETEREAELVAPASWAERPGWAALAAADAPAGAPAETTAETGVGPGTPPDGAPTREDTVCPVTGEPVAADSPTWPFSSERARMADLYRWFSGSYEIRRPMTERDLEEGV